MSDRHGQDEDLPSGKAATRLNKVVLHRNDNHRLRAIAKVIGELLPGTDARALSLKSPEALNEIYPTLVIPDGARAGFARSGRQIGLWFTDYERIELIEISRKYFDLTNKEIDLLRAFAKVLDGLYTDSTTRMGQNVSRVSAKYSLGNILIAHILTGKASDGFWSVSMTLDLLQELALRRYEGKNCSSGFLLVAQPQQQLAKFAAAGLEIDEFGPGTFLSEDFFEGVISHRFVDGRNSFYIVDNLQSVRGVARIRNPGQFSIYERSATTHLDAALEIPNGRLTAAFIGRNSDVVVKSKAKPLLRWNKLYWRATDLTLIDDAIISFGGMPEAEASALAKAILTCSDLRFGTLCLVARDLANYPNVFGKIDQSNLSGEVTRISAGKSVSELLARGTVLGILSSDGLTTWSSKGTLVSSGDILDLSSSTGPKYQMQGGGRTQAALAASQYGLAIKVSEDGPITFFEQGKVILELMG